MAAKVGEENLGVKAIGIKVGGTLRRRGYRTLSNERRPEVQDREGLLKNLSRDLLEAWESGRYRRIDLVYSTLDGMTVRKPAVVPWLPIPGFEEDSEKRSHGSVGKYIDEPSEEEVLREAILRTLGNELLSAFLQSEASEHVARMVAMDNATRNAEELFTSLQLTYNKARQAKITQEICEIVAGANAIG
jgi:F-type H+-transporting ATPase subunit gamma